MIGVDRVARSKQITIRYERCCLKRESEMDGVVEAKYNDFVYDA